MNSNLRDSHFLCKLSFRASFLGKIQKYFSENNSSYNDIQLSKCSYDLFTVIDSKDALILQKGSYFSPFEICCTYDAGIITTAEALVTDSLTERVISDYTVSVSQNDEFHLWLTVKNSSEEDYTLPQVRYPLAQDDPSFYIHTQTVIPYTLDLRSYTPVSVYSIGTDAAEGTVAVRKQGQNGGGQSVMTKEEFAKAISDEVAEMMKNV